MTRRARLMCITRDRALLISGMATLASTTILTIRPAMLQWRSPMSGAHSEPNFRPGTRVAASDELERFHQRFGDQNSSSAQLAHIVVHRRLCTYNIKK